MSKIKIDIPKDIRGECAKVIHTATTASGVAGAIPLPMSDTVPITTAQIAMIVSLGKEFELSISESLAKSILSITLVQQAGRIIATNIIKCIPGAGTIIGGAIGATTAVALTEALGWMVAEDFYRMSIGEEPENIGKEKEVESELRKAFKDARFSDENKISTE